MRLRDPAVESVQRICRAAPALHLKDESYYDVKE